MSPRRRAIHRAGGPGRRPRRPGFTLVEIMLALAIAAFILVGGLTALRAGLVAYGTSTEDAGRQTAARLVMHRTLDMVRTARLHDPYDPAQPGLELLDPGHDDHPLRTVGITLIDPGGLTYRIWWRADEAYGDADLGDLVISEGAAVSEAPQTLLRRVRCQRTDAEEPYVFTLASRTSDEGLLLARATLHLFAEGDAETTTELERNTSAGAAVQLVRSTAPRQNLR